MYPNKQVGARGLRHNSEEHFEFSVGDCWTLVKEGAANFVTIYVNAIGLSLVFIELAPIPKSNNGPLPTMTFPMSAAPPSIYSQH